MSIFLSDVEFSYDLCSGNTESFKIQVKNFRSAWCNRKYIVCGHFFVLGLA